MPTIKGEQIPTPLNADMRGVIFQKSFSAITTQSRHIHHHFHYFYPKWVSIRRIVRNIFLAIQHLLFLLCGFGGC